MKKVETYKEQPPLPLPLQQQQQPPPLPLPLPLQQQQQPPPLPLPLQQQQPPPSLPPRKFNYRTNKKIYKKRLNDQIPLSLYPKSPFIVFSELFKGIPFYLQEHLLHNTCMSYTATLNVDGQIYCGNGISIDTAKERACESFLRIMLAKKLSEQSEESPMDVEMEFEANDSVSKPEAPYEKDFPWPHFVSLAMYNLMNHWKIQPVKLTFFKPKPRNSPMKNFPKNPKNRDPVQILTQMKPEVKFTEIVVRKLSANCPTIFQVNCILNDILFTGQGPKKKAAKKECCIAAIKYFWKFDFHAIKNN